VHDLRDLAGRTRRLLVSIAVGVGGVVLIVFAIESLIGRNHVNGFDVWMMFVGVVGLAIANFHLLEWTAHRPTLPRAVIRKCRHSVNSRMPADAPCSQPSR
jgi:hypothetical protein